MTNAELIALLQRLPPELPIMMINHHNAGSWRIEDIDDPEIRARERPDVLNELYICITSK